MLTHARLRELLHYNPVTGVWTRRTGLRAGQVAGAVGRKGYRQISVVSQSYLSARLAWFYMTGAWPLVTVDHRKPGFEFRCDDRWSNLRLATIGQNNANRVSKKFKGVTRVPSGRYKACIGRGNSTYLGMFDTPEAAHAAYLVAAQQRYGEFAQGGVS